jgi:glucose-6-phosphate isomerase
MYPMVARLDGHRSGVYLDYSNTRISDETLKLLVQLPTESGLKDRIKAMFQGEGHTGMRVRNIVNIGIGGSDLGPVMPYGTLRHYSNRELTFRFILNVDSTDLYEALRDLDPSVTLFIVSSKTFTTLETMANARAVRA